MGSKEFALELAVKSYNNENSSEKLEIILKRANEFLLFLEGTHYVLKTND